MPPRDDVIRRFYACFARGDADGMAACYADDVVFSDPVFGTLRGAEAGDMWRMLCARAKGDLIVEAHDVHAEGDSGRARWTATYPFGTRKRVVHNVIHARFRFNAADLIVEHHDAFDLWRRARMALGAPGVLLGWSPLVQNKVRKQARAGLEAFRARAP